MSIPSDAEQEAISKVLEARESVEEVLDELNFYVAYYNKNPISSKKEERQNALRRLQQFLGNPSPTLQESRNARNDFLTALSIDSAIGLGQRYEESKKR